MARLSTLVQKIKINNDLYCSGSLQSRRILKRDPWIVFRNDVVPPSWLLILPESWDESKSDFKGEVDGFKIGEEEGRGGKKKSFSFLFKMAATINVPPSFR